MEISIQLKPPVMPDTIPVEAPPRPRQDGFIHAISINVRDLTNAQAEEYGELMKQTFIQHHKTLRFNQENGKTVRQ